METAKPARKSHNRRRPTAKAKTISPDPASLARHQRFCSICQHPNREDIDDDILRWRSFEEISFHFRLGSRSAVYRHARALNLLDQRKENLCPALETLIESVYRAKPTGNTILKAMTIYARINGNNSFADPPKRVIVSHENRPPRRGATTKHELEGHAVNRAENADASPFIPAKEGATQRNPAGASEKSVEASQLPASSIRSPEPSPTATREKAVEAPAPKPGAERAVNAANPPTTENIAKPDPPVRIAHGPRRQLYGIFDVPVIILAFLLGSLWSSSLSSFASGTAGPVASRPPLVTNHSPLSSPGSSSLSFLPSPSLPFPTSSPFHVLRFSPLVTVHSLTLRSEGAPRYSCPLQSFTIGASYPIEKAAQTRFLPATIPRFLGPLKRCSTKDDIDNNEPRDGCSQPAKNAGPHPA